MVTAAVTLVLLLQAAPQADPSMGAGPAGSQGRPPAGAASPIQARIDAAPAGAVVRVPAGVYRGDLYIDRPMTLVGEDRPTLIGSGHGSVVIVRAAGVRIEGFDIDAHFAGSLNRDSSGIHVSAPGVVIRDVTVTHAFFGVYLLGADDATLERVTVWGQAGRPAGEQGSGIHLYNAQRFSVVDSAVVDMRDGIYIQSASNGRVTRTDIRRVRYGLHYMYADDNAFEDNRFEDSDAGAALMFSRRLTFRRNRFVRNRGFASVGLLLKDCDDLVAEENVIVDNARGIFLDGSSHNRFERNVIAVSDAALVIFASVSGNVFRDNAFVANLTPLELVGRRTDTVFDRNYWSDADEPDLDGDGFRDAPYRVVNVFDHFRGRTTASDLLARGPAARALAAAERSFPLLSPANVFDRHPRVRMPPGLITAGNVAPASGGSRLGVIASAVALTLGLAAVAHGRRRWRMT